MTTIWTIEQARTSHVNCPSLVPLLASIFPIGQPILDLGCGSGFYISELERLSEYLCNAIEGTAGIGELSYFKRIIQADLSKPLELELVKSNILSLEVGEHIPPEYEQVFLDNVVKFALNRIVLSWFPTPEGAKPNENGIGHNNERPNEYIISEMDKRGFSLNKDLTHLLRTSYNKKEAWWFESSLMVFDRKQP